jgi:hypothetical protein
MSLETILRAHVQPAGLAGRASSSALERDLRRHGRLMAIAYASLLAVLLVILLGVGVMLVLDVRDGRGVRTGVLAGAGVTFPVTLEVIRRTVREWTRTDLVRVLSRQLDDRQLQSVIAVLLDGKEAAPRD